MKEILKIHKCKHCHCIFYKCGRTSYCSKCVPYQKLSIKKSDFADEKEYQRERYRLRYQNLQFRNNESFRRANEYRKRLGELK